jgi:hydrogenase maturation protease
VPRALLVGYGNTLRGDDALGPLAIERLRTLLPEAEFVSCHQLGPELAGQMAAFDLVLFIDARGEGKPGTVRVERLSPNAGHVESLTHHVHPAALLELTETLYGQAPWAMLVTGVGTSFELREGTSREGLSEAASFALEEICRIVPGLVKSYPELG